MAEPGEMALRFCDIGFGVADRLSLLALDEGQLVIFRIDKPALVAAGCADVAGLLEADELQKIRAVREGCAQAYRRHAPIRSKRRCVSRYWNPTSGTPHSEWRYGAPIIERDLPRSRFRSYGSSIGGIAASASIFFWQAIAVASQ